MGEGEKLLDFPSNGKTPEDDYPAGDPLASAEREGRRGTGTPAGLTESRRSNRRFKYQTVAITAFILAVLVGFSYQIYVEAKGDIEKQFNRQQLFLADQASGRIESFLDKLTSSLLYSASFLRTVGPNHPGRMSAIAGLYEHIGDGVRVSEVGYIREGRETEPQVPAEYLTALRRCGADRGACLLPVNYKGMTDYILGFAPVSEKDWLYAKVTVEDLNRAFVEPVQSGLRGRAWLLDGEGRILIGPGASGREGTELGSLAEQSGDDRLKRIFRRMRRGERGYDWHFDFGAENFGKRKRTLTAFSPLRVESVRWSLAVTAPSSEVVRLVRRTFRKELIITSFGIIVVISAALLIFDRDRRRIRAEENLLWSAQVVESKRRLEALFDGIPDSICILDKDNRIRMLNWGLARLVGRDLAELVNQPLGGGKDSPMPESLAERALVAECFQSGRGGYAERSVQLPGRKRTELEIYTYPILDADGETVQVILYLRDVTDRRELQRQLLQRDRLTIVGKMSAQVAHEIRNPLSSINLNAELLEDELRRFKGMDTAEAWSLLDSVKTEVDILRQVTDDYLKFVRMPREDHRPGDVNSVIEELLVLHGEEAASRRIEIERGLDENTPDVDMDETQLHVALQNLVLNAFDAMEDGGKLTVRTSFVERGVEITLIDNGAGIRPEDQASLFTPFFTTKANGTGLGLALAQQIIHEHRGTIRFASQEGEGTTFRIFLPAARQEARV